MRPAAVLEPRPQGPVQRHTAQHIVDILPHVQILDVPVPQMGGQLVDFMQNLDTSTLDEQVIVVPKISLDRIPQSSALRRTQKAEQLVEVPTDSAYALGAIVSSALGGGLQGPLQEQDSLRLQRAVEQIMDIPVRGRGDGGARGGLQGFPPRQSTTVADVEQIVDIPARRGLPDFLPGQGSAASSSRRLHDHADEGIQGVFLTFPGAKKVRRSPASRVRSCLERSALGRRCLIMRRVTRLWLTLSWSPTCGGTKRDMCGCISLQSRHGGTCCRIQRCTGTSWGDAVACDRAAAVPAVRRVLRASGSVLRQNGGHSSCMYILVRTV